MESIIKFIKKRIRNRRIFKTKNNDYSDFCNTTPTIINGSIRKIDKTNLTYIEPHRIIIKDNLYLAFNYSEEQVLGKTNWRESTSLAQSK